METPFYRVKEKDLLYDIHLLQSAMKEYWDNYICGYSVKTNALPWLLVYLKAHGFYAEVVSAMEYDLVVRLGFSEDKIIYNSPIKDRLVWEKVLLGGGIVNFDSTQELEWIKELVREYPEKSFSIGLRVNCDLSRLCPKEEPADAEGGRFGYCYENGILEKTICELKELQGVRIAGLHLHSSTKSRSVNVYGALADLAVTIAKEFSLNISFIDMGGGYFGGRDTSPDYRDYFKKIGERLREYFDPQKVTLIAEPGVSLISRAITFETSVLDIKDIRGDKMIVTDGSRVYLNPQVTRRWYPHHIIYAPESGSRENIVSQWICGSTCMEYDRLFRIENGVELKPGDRIVYDTAGGYTMCLTPLFINYFPKVWIEKENGDLFLARDGWTNEEYLQKYYW